MNRFLIIVLTVLLLSQNVSAQQGADSSHRAGHYAPATGYGLYHEKFIGTRQLISIGLIAYGAASLHLGAFKMWNENLREEVWDDIVHKQTKVDNYLQWTAAAAVYGLNLAGIKGKHNFKDRTFIYGISMAIVTVTTEVAKTATGEWRPDHSNNKSFPSGHTATAFAGAEFMRREYSDVSPWYGIAGYAAAVATGCLRIYNNKHWIGDVAAGAGVGMLSTDIAYWLYPIFQRKFSGHTTARSNQSNQLIYPFYQQGTFGLGFTKTF